MSLVRLRRKAKKDEIGSTHRSIGFTFGALEQQFAKRLWYIRKLTMQYVDGEFEIEVIVEPTSDHERSEEWCERIADMPYPLAGYHYYGAGHFWETWDSAEVVDLENEDDDFLRSVNIARKDESETEH